MCKKLISKQSKKWRILVRMQKEHHAVDDPFDFFELFCEQGTLVFPQQR